jgi:hypothetical protein
MLKINSKMNKQFILVLFVLALSGNSFAQSKQEIMIPTTCSNAFIARFRASKDTQISGMILTTPQKTDFSICSHEWNTYGSCCDPEKVKLVAQKRISEWSNKMKFIETRIRKNIWNIKYRVQKISTALNSATLKARASPDAIARAKNYATNFKEVLDFFDERRYKPMKEKFFSSVKTCFQKVKEFRLNALCTQCSGRASMFLEGSKMRMSAESCTDIVKECVGQWDFMYQFMQSLKTINFMGKVNKTIGKTTGDELKTDSEQGPETSENSKSIIENLNALSNIDKESIVFNDDVSSLCSKLFVFDGYNDDLTGDEKVVEEVAKEEDEADKTMAKETVSEKSKRLLAIRNIQAE